MRNSFVGVPELLAVKRGPLLAENGTQEEIGIGVNLKRIALREKLIEATSFHVFCEQNLERPLQSRFSDRRTLTSFRADVIPRRAKGFRARNSRRAETSTPTFLLPRRCRKPT